MELNNDEFKKAKNREYCKKWREANKDKFKEIQKAFYQNNIKCNEEYKKHIYKNNNENRIKRRTENGEVIKKRGRPKKLLFTDL